MAPAPGQRKQFSVEECPYVVLVRAPIARLCPVGTSATGAERAVAPDGRCARTRTASVRHAGGAVEGCNGTNGVRGLRVHLDMGDSEREVSGLVIEGRRPAVYGELVLTRTLDAATWGAELAAGDATGRIYLVEPTGPFEDDPNLTNARFRATRPSRSAPVRLFG